MSRLLGIDLLLLTSCPDSRWRWGCGRGQRLLLHAAPGFELLPVPPRYQRVAVLLRVCRRCGPSIVHLSTARVPHDRHPKDKGAHMAASCCAETLMPSAAMSVCWCAVPASATAADMPRDTQQSRPLKVHTGNGTDYRPSFMPGTVIYRNCCDCLLCK